MNWTREGFAAIDRQEKRIAYSIWEGFEMTGSRARELASGREHDLGAPLPAPLWSADGEVVYGSSSGGDLLACLAGGVPAVRSGAAASPTGGPTRGSS